jgi:Cdc6-like AAA superfamily ATPase
LCEIFTQKRFSCATSAMLVEFSVSNYRSFRDRVTLSMEAADIASQPPSLDEQNVFPASHGLSLLTSAVVYGANASGKSNLVAAINVMRTLVLNSSRDRWASRLISVEPFRLSTATETVPSLFEIVFLVDGTQYRYGFAVDRRVVVEEWLYRLGKAREATLFVRDRREIKVNPRTFREGRDLEFRTRPDALFLSVVAQFNGAIARRLTDWFAALDVNTGVTDWGDMAFALTSFETSSHRRTIEELIRRLDTGIERLELERLSLTRDVLDDLPEFFTQTRFTFLDELFPGETVERISINTYHQRFDAEGRPVDRVAFDLERHESAGTQRLFALAHPIVRALKEGRVLVIDEFDARLHPNLAMELIRLFNDPTTNPHHAQLIATTHNTNLLSARLFRRDQVWFVEKSRQGASDLYSLVEYRIDGKIVRNDASFEKDYILGRYGAIPFIGDLRELLGASHGEASGEE